MAPISVNKVISVNELWQFFNRSATLFCIAASNGYLTQINPYVIDLLGFNEDKLMSTPFIEFVHDHDRLQSLREFNKLNIQNPVLKIENRMLTAADGHKWVSWIATYIPGEDNIYLIGQDCTDAWLTKQKLMEEQNNRQKIILQATISAQERERKEIGEELHDNINQMLAGVLLYHQLATERAELQYDMIRKASDIVKQTIDEIRILSKSLTGPNLKHTSLIECIVEMIEPIKKGAKLEIVIEYSGLIEQLSEKLKISIFRILQEQFHNIQKHAQASIVRLSLQRSFDQFVVKIADNGQGFDQTVHRKGIGLNNIGSRVEIFNGTLNVETSPGKGCCLTITIPWTGDEQNNV